MDVVTISPLYDVGIVFAAAAILAYISSMLKQPLIPAYIIAGIIIGPELAALLNIPGYAGLVSDHALILTLSELGITFLLFIVGMEIDLSRLKDVGFVSSFGAIAQVLASFAFGVFGAVYFGYPFMTAIYLGLIVAFSSTMLVIKILQDKNEIDTLHGRIMLGFLLMQDILVVMAMSVIGNIEHFSPEIIIVALLKGIGLFSLAIVSSKYIFPSFVKSISKSSEVVFLTSLLVAFMFCTLSHLAGFSIAIGGFLAGISLAVFPYNLEIIGRISSLRDFFATIFFVSLGMQLVLTDIPVLIGPIILFSFIVLVIKPVLTTVIITVFGYEGRTAFISGTGLAQVSEFSLILAALGYTTGVLPMQIVSLTTILAVITITLTSYFIRYHNTLYSSCSGLFAPLKYLRNFGTHGLVNLPKEKAKIIDHIIICGAHTMGQGIIEVLQRYGKSFIVVDYNPAVIKKLIYKDIHCMYGDISHMEVLEKMNFKQARLIISTIPEVDSNKLLIEKCREVNPNTDLLVTANEPDEALELYDDGADYVILPKLISSERIGNYLGQMFTSKKDIDELRKKEIVYLERKKEEEIVDEYRPEYLKDLHRKIVFG